MAICRRPPIDDKKTVEQVFISNNAPIGQTQDDPI
jgi:hypothetical protein